MTSRLLYILNDLQDMIKATNKFYYVEEYQGEYDNDDWTEQHPSCLIEMNGKFPLQRDSRNNIAAERVDFTLYVGSKSTSGTHVLSLVDDLIDLLESESFSYSNMTTLQTFLVTVNLFGRNNDLMVYAMRFQLKP